MMNKRIAPMPPLCYRCARKPAKRLLGRAELVFCSLQCAAEQGLGDVLHGSDYWCEACRVWHGGAGCPRRPGRTAAQPLRRLGRLAEQPPQQQ